MPSCVPMMLFLHIAARPSANAASFETRLNAIRYCWGSSATTHILLALYFLCLVKLKKTARTDLRPVFCCFCRHSSLVAHAVHVKNIYLEWGLLFDSLVLLGNDSN